ncbi:MAG: hypothetical protein IPK57_10795 [Chitinophagaceae bacterium]|nr:hypothetical protein [Chitinophagaceae bacterium]
METGKYSGTAIVGISESVGLMALKGKATISALVEWDNTGFTDIGAVAV